MTIVRHGAFSYLPPLTDEEIAAQVSYALAHGWPVSVEHTDHPHPRNVYWHMWGLPLFDLEQPDGVMTVVNECRNANPTHYVRILAYDAKLGRQTTALSFLVQRPEVEPTLTLQRSEGADRQQTYSVVVEGGGPL